MRIRRLCELRMFRKRINHDRKEKTFRSPVRQTQKKKKNKRLKRVLKAIKSPDPAKRSERRRKMMENSRVSSGG